jgi:hypothetical protein
MAEKEYITREEVTEKLSHLRDKADDQMAFALNWGLKLLDNIPAADVEPVRHGEWITDNDGLPICSECEEVALQRVFIKLPEKIVDLQMVKSQRCPHCGAKMDGRNNNG